MMFFACISQALAGFAGLSAQLPPPIIDMHLHARDAPDPPRLLCLPVTIYGVDSPVCEAPLVSPETDSEMVEKVVGALERRNVFGVISGYPLERVDRFRRAAPDRLIPAYQFSLGKPEPLTPGELRQHIEAGRYQVLGEIELQYDGILPNDPRMAAYWALAEELNIPVALHLGEGYPGAPYDEDGTYRVGLGSPLLLEDVLVRYPALRLYVMHYGSPLVDEMIGIMYAYPNVYIDVGGNLWPYPRAYVYRQLRQFIDAGFEKRILFGSDQMVWPDLIEESIRVIEEAPFLTASQKRDILYCNAARFLRLSDAEMAAQHEGATAGGNCR